MRDVGRQINGGWWLCRNQKLGLKKNWAYTTLIITPKYKKTGPRRVYKGLYEIEIEIGD